MFPSRPFVFFCCFQAQGNSETTCCFHRLHAHVTNDIAAFANQNHPSAIGFYAEDGLNKIKPHYTN